MAINQGDVGLLNDPVAQELLRAPIPARLAYNWKDGSPRVIPIGFFWTGEEIVMCGTDGAPRNQVIDQSRVAITIDSTIYPFKVLLIRGTARVTKEQGIPEEYIQACVQLMGNEVAQGWFKTLEPLAPNIKYFARVAVKPDWVGILDFETRFPSPVVKAMNAG